MCSLTRIIVRCLVNGQKLVVCLCGVKVSAVLWLEQEQTDRASVCLTRAKWSSQESLHHDSQKPAHTLVGGTTAA